MKLVSGGQTGADRAALDVALELGIDHGGWVPKGRAAEDGRLPDRYRVRETPSDDQAERTERNVADSDATLLISHGPLAGGSELTRRFAVALGKPVLHVELGRLGAAEAADRIARWLGALGCRTLNVAGPRASEEAGIHAAANLVLRHVVSEHLGRQREDDRGAAHAQAANR